MQIPTVGRVVHYVAYGTPGGEYPSIDRAAIITEVDEPGNEKSAVGLAVLNPTGLFFNQHVLYGTAGGHWHWPPILSPIAKNPVIHIEEPESTKA
ncbi:MAG TPA: hypothetical protein VGC91_07985 [Pyrinomonadaceae bacterium]|jgi:hypothetical protein